MNSSAGGNLKVSSSALRRWPISQRDHYWLDRSHRQAGASTATAANTLDWYSVDQCRRNALGDLSVKPHPKVRASFTPVSLPEGSGNLCAGLGEQKRRLGSHRCRLGGGVIEAPETAMRDRHATAVKRVHRGRAFGSVRRRKRETRVAPKWRSCAGINRSLLFWRRVGQAYSVWILANSAPTRGVDGDFELIQPRPGLATWSCSWRAYGRACRCVRGFDLDRRLFGNVAPARGCAALQAINHRRW